MTRRELAESNFVAGYSCAQAVVKAFADVTGFDGEAAMRLCSSFGGGMGRLREVCGAVSGMFIVEGLLEGYFDPTEQDAQAQKAAHYARIQELARRFKERNASIVCREILGAICPIIKGSKRTSILWKHQSHSRSANSRILQNASVRKNVR